MSIYLNKELETKARNSILESTEVLEERTFFFSPTGKEFKKKVKAIEASAFENFFGSSFTDRLKGAFNGENNSKLKDAFNIALKGVINLLQDGHAYGPVKRTRQTSQYSYEEYYVYIVFGWYKNIFFRVEMETKTTSFWLKEMDKIKVPEEAIKIAFNLAAKDNGELVIGNKSISYLKSGALLKLKEFGQRLYNECTYKHIPCKLSGAVVKFK